MLFKIKRYNKETETEEIVEIDITEKDILEYATWYTITPKTSETEVDEAVEESFQLISEILENQCHDEKFGYSDWDYCQNEKEIHKYIKRVILDWQTENIKSFYEDQVNDGGFIHLEMVTEDDDYVYFRAEKRHF